MIVIIDYGVGNSGSILNMLKRIGSQALISSNYKDISHANKLILPGVGAFDNCMNNLREHGLLSILNDKVLNEKTPILGICVGMQLFSEGSEEGIHPGLGWIKGETVKFHFDKSLSHLKIPHMGWNTIQIKKKSPILNNMFVEPRFYFVHSYHVKCINKDDILTTTNYGFEFVSAIQHNNIIGTQFHPEKSHKYGMRFFTNFAMGL